MKPVFALNLSHEGIILLHRSPRGKWTEVGDVALDDPNMKENLSFLRSTAVGLEGKGFGTKLILPAAQVLYREIHAPGPGENERRAQILAALEGKTPYEVDDLTFDWTGKGPTVEVAVVWNETLDEAEEFAIDHRFNPISFVGDARAHPDGWEPFFGRTDFCHSFLGANANVRDTPEPDQIAPANDRGVTASKAPENTKATETPAPKQPTAPRPENMFAGGEADATSENIFAEDVDKQPDTSQTPDRDDKTDVPNLAAFSSRRDHNIQPELIKDHPVSHIAPRIGIIADPESDQPAPPPEASNPTAPDAVHSKNPGNRSFNEVFKALTLLPRIAAVTRQLTGGILKTGSAASAFGGKLLHKFSRQDRTPATSDGVSQAKKPGFGALITSLRSNRLAIIFMGVLGVVVLLALAYTMMRSQGQTGANIDAPDTPITRAAARGVTVDNPPAHRPADFAVVVAAAKGTTADTPSNLPLIRPSRRSKYEGKTDPQANLPDTASQVTNLTEQELADIHAAGLKSPTKEELADLGVGNASGGMTSKDIAVAYAATGILQRLRKLPSPLANPERGDIFVAGIDRKLTAGDAIILPDFSAGPRDAPPGKHMSPLDPDVTFDFDSKGFVKPTKSGALNPQGILVFLGKPTLTPPEKPKTDVLVPPDPLTALKPKPRPDTLKTGEDAIFVQGRMTMAQLRVKRPRPRPISIQTELANSGGTTPSELAVLTSFLPAKRPSDFAKTVQKTRVKVALATPATARINDAGPVLPIRASVAKNATIRNGINLSQISLIGVYGTEAKRRALLRLPTGRYVRVKKGDRLSGGQIAAIGVDSLRFVKGGRNRLMKMPRE